MGEDDGDRRAREARERALSSIWDLVPSAPGWWWWREHVSKRWTPIRIGRDQGDGGLYAEDDGQFTLPNHIGHGEWGGRCLGEPRQ